VGKSTCDSREGVDCEDLLEGDAEGEGHDGEGEVEEEEEEEGNGVACALFRFFFCERGAGADSVCLDRLVLIWCHLAISVSLSPSESSSEDMSTASVSRGEEDNDGGESLLVDREGDDEVGVPLDAPSVDVWGGAVFAGRVDGERAEVELTELLTSSFPWVAMGVGVMVGAGSVVRLVSRDLAEVRISCACVSSAMSDDTVVDGRVELEVGADAKESFC
jgi:hypothetical protein